MQAEDRRELEAEAARLIEAGEWQFNTPIEDYTMGELVYALRFHKEGVDRLFWDRQDS